MEWAWVIGAAIVAAIMTMVKAHGESVGETKERKKSAQVAEQFEEKLADAQMEVEINKPFAAKLAAWRERLKSRRGMG